MTRQTSLKWLKAIVYVGIYGGLLMPLVFLPVVIFPFVFSKLIFFQMVVGLTFPAYLILAWVEPAYRPKKNILFLAILSYFIALALSVIFAVDPFRAWWGNQERMNGFFTLLHFFAWLTMTIGVLKTWKSWERLLTYEVVLSGIMAIVPYLQQVKHDLLLFVSYGRVGGLLDNPIYMGAYQIFNLFFLALLFLKNPSRKARIFYGVIALLDIGAFMMAQSRGALVGLAAGIGIFAIYYALFTHNKKARYGILGAALLFFLSYGVLFAFRDTPFIQNSMLGRITYLGGIEGRFIAWKISWQGFLERPITGWGFDNYHILFNLKFNPLSLRAGSYETWFDRSHNTVLDVLSMTGLVGFLTYFSIFGAIFYGVWRAFKKKWVDLPIAAILTALPVAYFVQNLFVFDHPAAFSMSFLLFALTIAATRGDFSGGTQAEIVKPADGRVRQVSWIAFTIVFLAGVLLVWRTSALPFKASMISIAANQTFTQEAAYAKIKQASEIWTPYLDEQTFLLSRNLMAYAAQGTADRVPHIKEIYAVTKQITAEELRRHPRNTHPHFVFARLLQDMSAYDKNALAESEQQYKIAIDTSPKRQQVLYGLARLYLLEGRKDEALDIYRQVRDFDPELGMGYWTYGVSLFYDKGDTAEGAKQIIQSQTVTYAYLLQDARELVPLLDAYAIANDAAGLETALLKNMANLPMSGSLYAQVAVKLEQINAIGLRDKILDMGMAVDSSTRALYEGYKKPVESTVTAPAK